MLTTLMYPSLNNLISPSLHSSPPYLIFYVNFCYYIIIYYNYLKWNNFCFLSSSLGRLDKPRHTAIILMWGRQYAGMGVKIAKNLAFFRVFLEPIACTIGSIALKLAREMPHLGCKMNAGIHVWSLKRAVFSIWIGNNATIISGSAWAHVMI